MASSTTAAAAAAVSLPSAFVDMFGAPGSNVLVGKSGVVDPATLLGSPFGVYFALK